MATAGRILIIPRGDYSGTYTYEMLDMVNYNGATWIAKKTALGVSPSIGSEYWFKILGTDPSEIPSLVNNLTTTAGGYALDARQGKVLDDKVTALTTRVSISETDITALETSLAQTKSSLSQTNATLSQTNTSLSQTNASLSTVNTSLATLSASLETVKANATIIKGTLAVGATSISLSNARITTNSMMSFYTSVWGVNPITVAVTSGKVTLTFEAQTVAMEVGVRIDG